MNIEEMLLKAKDCELKASEAYDHFAKMFTSDSKAHAFWKDLSSDEKEHAAFISSMLSELTAEQKTMEADYSQWYPIITLFEYMIHMPCNSIKSVQEAYTYTEKIENSEFTRIVHLLLQEFIPDDKRNEVLHKQLQTHYKKIEEFKSNTT